ncbi:hypothetical protein [Candidatus Accumulibacter phosphatis]|nr:hypothetical protein [Candidatus Accumulibacter phosphatis]
MSASVSTAWRGEPAASRYGQGLLYPAGPTVLQDQAGDGWQGAIGDHTM